MRSILWASCLLAFLGCGPIARARSQQISSGENNNGVTSSLENIGLQVAWALGNNNPVTTTADSANIQTVGFTSTPIFQQTTFPTAAVAARTVPVYTVGSTETPRDDGTTTTVRQGTTTEIVTVRPTTAIQSASDSSSSTPARVSPPTIQRYPNDKRKDDDACTAEGYFPDEKYCARFYRCVPMGYAFVKHSFTCPLGTIWDDSVKSCNYPLNVQRTNACVYDKYLASGFDTDQHPTLENARPPAEIFTVNSWPIECPTGFRKHPKYCNVFYQCTVDERLKVNFAPFVCPQDWVFDANQSRCRRGNSTRGTLDPHGTNCEMYSGNSGWIQTLRLPRVAKLCPKERQFPYESVCPTQYFKCVKNKQGTMNGYLLTCPKGYVYSTVASGCVPMSTFPFCVHRYQSG